MAMIFAPSRWKHATPQPAKKPETFASRLQASGGRPAGFDYLRIILATGVIFFHSLDLTAGHNFSFHDLHGVFRPFDAIVLLMFFSLSGFLVAGSLQRSRTLISFLGLRAIRILPALVVETCLSAILIGLLFTRLPLRTYFADPGFRHYFLNILGDIHFNLPGIFLANPMPRVVNGQLWTIPWELRCYATLAALSLFGLARHARLFFAALLLLSLALFVHHVFFGGQRIDHKLNDLHVHGVLLVQCFLYGIALFLLRERVVWSKWLFLAAIPLCYGLLSLPVAFYGDYLVPLPAAYITIYLGLLEPKRLRIVSTGDYSYGVYLYGFAIQQAVIATTGRFGLHWAVNFGLSMVVAIAVAVCSWHLVEKPALELRPLLFRLEASIVKGLSWARPKPLSRRA